MYTSLPLHNYLLCIVHTKIGKEYHHHPWVYIVLLPAVFPKDLLYFWKCKGSTKAEMWGGKHKPTSLLLLLLLLFQVSVHF